MQVPRFLPAAVLLAAVPLVSGRSQTERFADLHEMMPRSAGFPPLALELGDVDADGDLDLLLGGSAFGSSSANRLYLQDSSGRFVDESVRLPALPMAGAWDVALGDVDGDGDLDALIGFESFPPAASHVRLCLNDGQGFFSDAPAQVPPISVSVRALAPGDVDGDGDLDIVVGGACPSGSCGAPALRLLVNDGTGAFADATGQLPPQMQTVRAVSLGDVDGDLDLDILFSSLGTVALFLNGGTGMFSISSPPPPFLSGFAIPYALALGDVDADGDTDALIGGSGVCAGGTCEVTPALWLNDGSGDFIDSSGQIPPIAFLTRAAVLHDVDADGDLDAFLGNFPPCGEYGCTPAQNALLLNDGSGTFSDASSQLPSFPSGSVALGDLDGDGDPDAIAGPRMLTNDGAGTFTDVSQPYGPGTTGGANPVAIGDVDGDGDSDLLAATVPNQTIWTLGYFENLGSGAFAADPLAIGASYGNASSAKVALGDLDGDGDLDILVAGSPCRVFLNDGSGGFGLPWGLTFPGPSDASAAALDDVDADGDLDAVVGAGTASPDALFLNDGSATFSPAPFPAVLDVTNRVAIDDVDGDGDPDALFAGGSPFLFQPDRLYLNDGSGSFALAPAALPLIYNFTHDAEFGDVDGDGDLDLFLANSVLNLLHLNDGAGSFSNASTQIPGGTGDTYSVALGDMDGDGDPDALLGSNAGPRVFQNGGAGLFTDATSSLPPPDGVLALHVALHDLDEDGDLDGVLANGGPRVLWNISRQLAWRALPRVGRPLTMDLYGPAWGAWFLVTALAPATVPMPPFGTVRLDLSLAIPLLGGIFDANGRAAVAYAVPASPILIGQSLYWQALVVGAPGPPRLTNLETTTFTNP